MTRVLFVCLGNICRSPLGEGILRRMADEAGIELVVDSAGTGDYHVGELPDHRARAEGIKRGCDMSMRARQFRAQDLVEFDLIVAMDHANIREIRRWHGNNGNVRLAMSFHPDAVEDVVPDPYYGSLSDFEQVADMLEAACKGILEEIASGNRFDGAD